MDIIDCYTTTSLGVDQKNVYFIMEITSSHSEINLVELNFYCLQEKVV